VKKIIVICALLFGLAGALITYLGPPSYTAIIELLVEKGAVYRQLASSYHTLKTYIGHQKDIIVSPAILEKVVKDLHLDIADEYIEKDPLKELAKQIRVELIGESLIKINVTTGSSHLSVRIAQVVEASYREAIAQENFSWAKKIDQWLKEGWFLVKAMNQKEFELNKIAAGRDIASLTKDLEAIKSTIDDLEEKMLSLQEQNAEVTRQYNEVKRLSQLPLSSLFRRLDSPRLKELEKEYQDIEKKREELSEIYVENHPSLLRLQQDRDRIEGNVRGAVDAILKEYQHQISFNETEIATYDEYRKQERKKYEELLGERQKIAALAGELAYLKSKYEDVQQQMRERGVFPITITFMGLTPQSATPVVEHKDYAKNIGLFALLGVITGIIISSLLTWRRRAFSP